MATKRLTRKQLLKEPDEFLTTTGRVIAWAKSNPRQLITGVGIFIAVVLLVSGYRFYGEQRAQAASRLLSRGLENYQQQIEAKDQIQAQVAANPDFDKLVKEFKGQPAGRLGNIYYGHILLKAKKPKEAVDLFQKAWADYGNDPALTNIILNGMAEAYLQAGNKAAAMAQFEKIVAGSVTTHKDAALFQLGVLYLQSGQEDESKKMFKQLGEDFPNSMYAEMAKEKIAG